MDAFPLSKLNAELESLRRKISEDIRWFTDNADSLTKESAEERMKGIKDLQTEIQNKTNEFLNLKASATQSTAYTQEQISELSEKFLK